MKWKCINNHLPTYKTIQQNKIMCFLLDFVDPNGYCCSLSLGFATKARACKSAGQEEARESHFMLLRVQKSVSEWTLTLPRELSLWELKSRSTPESSESDRRGQNSLDWGVSYIIGKILELRFLKWARMTHLDAWNTSYAQKKGWESN
jgi:hypothetical protein